MRFSRAEALLFFRVQNLIDERFIGIFMVCYENFRQHPYYSTFILGESPAGKSSLDCQSLYYI